MADVPGMIRRPMPVKEITAGCLSIPVPFHAAPKRGNSLADVVLSRVVAVEILPSCEQALYKKCGLHQVAAVVVFAEVGVYAPGASVEKMRPCAMKSIGP